MFSISLGRSCCYSDASGVIWRHTPGSNPEVTWKLGTFLLYVPGKRFLLDWVSRSNNTSMPETQRRSATTAGFFYTISLTWTGKVDNRQDLQSSSILLILLYWHTPTFYSILPPTATTPFKSAKITFLLPHIDTVQVRHWTLTFGVNRPQKCNLKRHLLQWSFLV